MTYTRKAFCHSGNKKPRGGQFSAARQLSCVMRGPGPVDPFPLSQHVAIWLQSVCCSSRHPVHVQSEKKGKGVTSDELPLPVFLLNGKSFSEDSTISRESYMSSIVHVTSPILAAGRLGK